jgi:hypothetical protein
VRECPECRWVAVVDGTGRRRIEMRWQKPATTVDAPVVRAA